MPGLSAWSSRLAPWRRCASGWSRRAMRSAAARPRVPLEALDETTDDLIGVHHLFHVAADILAGAADALERLIGGDTRSPGVVLQARQRTLRAGVSLADAPAGSLGRRAGASGVL